MTGTDRFAISYLIVNRDGGSLLAEALDSIAAQTVGAHEVIVVDNGSSDRSWDLPHFERPGWRLLRLDRNAGFSEANNIAFACSRAEIVALVNNDVVLDQRWAEEVSRAFEDPEVAAIACRLLQRKAPGLLDSAGFAALTCGATTSWKGSDARCFAGANHHPFGPVASAAAYRRSALERVGLFHPEYFAYYEDTDLAMRLVQAGMQVKYVDSAVGYHLGSATGKQGSDFQRYQLRRNIEFLYWVNMVGSLAWRNLPAHLGYEAVAFAGMALHGQAGVFLRAKRDALAKAGWILMQRRALRHQLQQTVGEQRARRALQGSLRPLWRAALVRLLREVRVRGAGRGRCRGPREGND